MAETKIKTKPTATSVDSYLDKIPDEQRRKDCKALVKIMIGGFIRETQARIRP